MNSSISAGWRYVSSMYFARAAACSRVATTEARSIPTPASSRDGFTIAGPPSSGVVMPRDASRRFTSALSLHNPTAIGSAPVNGMPNISSASAKCISYRGLPGTPSQRLNTMSACLRSSAPVGHRDGIELRAEDRRSRARTRALRFADSFDLVEMGLASTSSSRRTTVVIPSVVEGPGRTGGAPPEPPGPSTPLGMTWGATILPIRSSYATAASLAMIPDRCSPDARRAAD